MRIKKNIAISDSGFIFNPDTGESFTSNQIAVEIFNLVKEEKQFEEIIKIVGGNYHVDQATLEKDYHDFIAMLEQYNILEDGEG